MTFRITGKVYLMSVLVAVAVGGLVLPALAQQVGTDVPSILSGPFSVSKVVMSNANTELQTKTMLTAATLTYTFRANTQHLVITFSAAGAIEADSSTSPAIMFVGCFVDGTPCIGSQNDPVTTPAGWVNVHSEDYPTNSAWDHGISYTWFTDKLARGTHTVVIKAAVGNPLVPFMGTGTLFIEARNLIVFINTP